jgi:hypothetical protein
LPSRALAEGTPYRGRIWTRPFIAHPDFTAPHYNAMGLLLTTQLSGSRRSPVVEAGPRLSMRYRAIAVLVVGIAGLFFAFRY